MALGKRAWHERKGAWHGAMLKLARGNTIVAGKKVKGVWHYGASAPINQKLWNIFFKSVQ